jgi:hypothetical protein
LYCPIALGRFYTFCFGIETIGWRVWSQIGAERTVGSVRHLPPPLDFDPLRPSIHPDRVGLKRPLTEHWKSYRMVILKIKFENKLVSYDNYTGNFMEISAMKLN